LNSFLNTVEEKSRNGIKSQLVRKNQYNATAQAIVDLYIRAGFALTTKRVSSRTKYFAIAPTGEQYPLSKTQYEYGSWKLYNVETAPESVPPSSNIPPVLPPVDNTGEEDNQPENEA